MHHAASMPCMHAHPERRHACLERIACRDLLASGVSGDCVAVEFAAQMKPHVEKVMQGAWQAKKEGETREAQNALAPLLTRAVAAEQPRRPAAGPPGPRPEAGVRPRGLELPADVRAYLSTGPGKEYCRDNARGVCTRTAGQCRGKHANISELQALARGSTQTR